MLKKSASFVLAALGGSTYRTEYAFASSLAAAALDGLFDHPAGCSDAVPDLLECCVAPVPKGFFNNLLDSVRLKKGGSPYKERAYFGTKFLGRSRSIRPCRRSWATFLTLSRRMRLNR